MFEYVGEAENRTVKGFSKIIKWLIDNFGEDKGFGRYTRKSSFFSLDRFAYTLLQQKYRLFQATPYTSKMEVRDWAKHV